MRITSWAGRQTKRRWIALFLALLALAPLWACRAQADPFAISRELLGLLWNVDYETFSSAPTAAFAKKYFERGYLENFLLDPDGETGVAENQANQLKSRLNSVANQGCEEQILGDTQYTVQRVQASVTLESFAPERPEESFFEQGESYLLNYQFYFVRQEGELKLAGFSFGPEGEAYLPSAEKEPLLEEEKSAVCAVALEYLRARYEVSYASFAPEEVYAFYLSHLSPEFLARDGITLGSLQALGEEFAANHVSIALLSHALAAGDQKTAYYDGQAYGYYYFVTAEYAYEITADAAYFASKDLASSKIVKEVMYFERQANGEFLMIGAEYV